MSTYYLALRIAGEAREIANKLKKEIRDGIRVSKIDLAQELGDVVWYLSEPALSRGISLDFIAEENIRKLTDRRARNVVTGSGS